MSKRDKMLREVIAYAGNVTPDMVSPRTMAVDVDVVGWVLGGYDDGAHKVSLRDGCVFWLLDRDRGTFEFLLAVGAFAQTDTGPKAAAAA